MRSLVPQSVPLMARGGDHAFVHSLLPTVCRSQACRQRYRACCFGAGGEAGEADKAEPVGGEGHRSYADVTAGKEDRKGEGKEGRASGGGLEQGSAQHGGGAGGRDGSGGVLGKVGEAARRMHDMGEHVAEKVCCRASDLVVHFCAVLPCVACATSMPCSSYQSTRQACWWQQLVRIGTTCLTCASVSTYDLSLVRC